MVFSTSQSLSDCLCLATAHDSIGYLKSLTRILWLLLGRKDYILEPVSAAWARWQDKQRAKRKRVYKKSNGYESC